MRRQRRGRNCYELRPGKRWQLSYLQIVKATRPVAASVRMVVHIVSILVSTDHGFSAGEYDQTVAHPGLLPGIHPVKPW
jgi:hypothetical protein